MGTKYSPSFTNYLKTSFNQAQIWGKSEEGQKWIKRHIPSLAKLIQTDYNTLYFGVYCIDINNKCIYVGASIRTVRRLVVHAYNICFNPALFGLEKEDIERIHISVRIVSRALFNKEDREMEELYYINKFRPVLQRPFSNTDLCVARSLRRKVMIEAGIVECVEENAMV